MVVGEFTVETDLVVIGAGPAGFSAAARARDLGVETTLVDTRDAPGGTWLYSGCLVSKELVRLAATIRAAMGAGPSGVQFAAPTIDLPTVQRTLAAAVATSAQSMAAAAEASGITWVTGSARFDSNRQLSIENNPAVPRIRFRRAIIACGVVPTVPDEVPTGPRVHDPASILRLTEVPARLIVLGGSTMALEIAGIFASFGSTVDLVMTGRPLLSADDDLVAFALDRLRPHLGSLTMDAVFDTISAGADDVRVTLRDGTIIVADALVHATGRHPDPSALALNHTDITCDDAGYVLVDETMRTHDPRIYAVGDITGEPLLSVKGIHQGRVAGEAIAGWGTIYDPHAVPMVVASDPAIAWCGLTEAELRARGEPVAVSQRGWPGVAGGDLHRHEGMTRIIYDPATQLILGAGFVGPGAAELVAEAVLAIEMGAVLADLAAIMDPLTTETGRVTTVARQTIDELPNAAPGNG